MHTRCPPAAIPLWRPLHRRLWARITGAMQALCASWPLQWHVRRGAAPSPKAPTMLQLPQPSPQASRRDWDGLDELNAHTLRDIGAPDWLVLTAAERRDAAQRLGDRFGAWRGV